MSRSREKLLEARAAEETARTRLMQTTGKVLTEIRPANIAGNAVESVKDAVSQAATKTGNVVKKRKGAIAAAGIGAVLLYFRKPITRFVRRKIEARGETERAVDALENSEDDKAGPRPDPIPTAPAIKELET